MIKAIETMHIRLWDANNKWCRRLDGSYVPKKVVRDWYPEHQPCPFVEGKNFYITNQGSAVIQRHIIRNYGTVIAGADPKTFINPVSKDGLRSTQGLLLKKWWQPLLEDPDWLNRGQKQPFAILTMCRALYTLEHGNVASKPAAAKWVKQTVGKNFATLINFVLAWEPDFEFDELRPSLEFIEYTLRHYSQNYQN
jgi:hypothetical protein